MMPVVALYARVSTEHQAETRTIEQQVEVLHAYARERGWEVVPERVYRDDGISGARLDRPALDRLRDAVARGEIDTLLITSPDRLARRYAYQVWVLEEFERAGCTVVFLERPPTGDPQDALVLQIRGAVAEYERTVIADRMRRRRLAALRVGKLLPWTVPPFGYQLDPTTPRDPLGVRIDAVAAGVVQQIFSWYVEHGLSLFSIAERLTKHQIPTAAGRSVWSPATINKILTNTAYQGVTYGNRRQSVAARRRYPAIGRESPGAGRESSRLRPREEWIGIPVPAIVSADLFAQAQERLSQNRKWARRNTRGEYLLRCLVSCRRCGLADQIWNNGRYAYYRCNGTTNSVLQGPRERCAARQIATSRLDDLVWEDVCQVFRDPTVLEEALRQAQQGWLTADERGAQRQDVQRRQHEIQRQIQRLVDAYAAAIISLEELGTRRVKLEDRLRALRQEEHHLAMEAQHDDQMQAVARQIRDIPSGDRRRAY